jgi:hypothetical protein
LSSPVYYYEYRFDTFNLRHDPEVPALEHEARLHDEFFIAMLEELMTERMWAGALVEPEG